MRGEGAYFTAQLLAARQSNRIGVVAPDPLMTLRAFVDIGGTGQNADSFAMWICQFVGMQVRVVGYYEAQGQPMATHAQWLRDKGYAPEKLQIWLPHDGEKSDTVYAVTPKSALQSLGYTVTVVPNQGKGAAMKRVEAARRLFPQIWIDEQTCSGGLDALAWYQEKRDEKRSIGLGPLHDWASHGADAFGLMCCVWEPPRQMAPLPLPNIGIV